MKTRIVPIRWIDTESRRLTAKPYFSGALEARQALKRHTCVPLIDVADGGKKGIFNGPRFSRVYVDDLAHGLPMLSGGGVLQADLSNINKIAKWQAKSMPEMILKEGTTLITSYGTVGRYSYARNNMVGMVASDNVLKIVPDKSKILSGYLYAFISGRYGLPILVSGEGGSVVTFLDPSRTYNVPIPRLGNIEEQAHNLINEASDLLCKYQVNVDRATELFFQSVGLKDITGAEWHNWGVDVGFEVTLTGPTSLRALNYNPRYQKLVDKIKSVSSKPLGVICTSESIKRGGRFLRVDGEPEFSYMMVGQKQIFWLRPEGRWIAKKFLNDDLIAKSGTTLIAAVGTLDDSEKYCRSEFIWGKATERAYSEHFYQIIPKNDIMPSGCLFAFIRSETAFRMLRSISSGTKLQIQRLDFLKDMPIPYPEDKSTREAIHKLIVDAYEAKDRAIELEDNARALVERAIEQGGR